VRAFEEVDLHVILESAERTDIALVGPDGGAPFPVFLQARIGVVDKLAQAGERLAAPVAEAVDHGVDVVGCRHRFAPLTYSKCGS
jgi:hypothetical protein